MESQELTTAPQESSQSMTVAGIHRQIQLIQEVMKAEMKEGEHFGTIPGCGPKPALLKAGAEKLALLFKMAPRFKVDTIDLGNGHREVRIVTELFHITSGTFLGEGLGSCSTMESKYRYRTTARKCPACEGEFIIKGKEEYGGGWLCFAKKGGCGAKFKDGDPVIESQEAGKTENPDIADTYNTVLKIGKKRSLIDATLTATAASDLFTQDIDENAPPAAEPAKARAAKIPEPQRAVDPDVYQEPPPEEGIDETPLDDDSPDDVKAPKAAPNVSHETIRPPAVGQPLPKDRRRMQSTFDGSRCADVACKGAIKKGDWIWKSPSGWAHEVHHA